MPTEYSTAQTLDINLSGTNWYQQQTVGALYVIVVRFKISGYSSLQPFEASNAIDVSCIIQPLQPTIQLGFSSAISCFRVLPLKALACYLERLQWLVRERPCWCVIGMKQYKLKYLSRTNTHNCLHAFILQRNLNRFNGLRCEIY